ncbi:hypothetical protein [Pseudomonas sp. TNT3]|uniref:hypothetical protein n=1 Tax=Pseudomonas sp. TNT3 TaxID=2654097 RepID=UPI001391B921|nr:hypothetical protein [Pseudomonas sp. TNT3]KAI2693118.1 hypothetical protein GBC55_007860 [Pseudomonas sp. TNT3]
MSDKFKPGDLALTLTSKYGFPSMAQVELIIFLLKDQKAEQPHGELWTAPHDGWVVGRKQEARGYGFFMPSQLMPLRGDFAPTGQKSKAVPA